MMAAEVAPQEGGIMRLSRPFVGAVLALVVPPWRIAAAQTPPPASAPAPAAAPAPATATQKPAGAQPIYSPSMGDLMTMLIQPRHIKLGLAGKAHNWVYAGYELNELRNAFGRIAHTIPTYRTMDTAQMVAAIMQRPLNALDHAIIAGDAAKFASAYDEVTQACNACHAGQQHPMVVIKVPDRTMFPDQSFQGEDR
jgi:hypothetical protein